MPPYLEYARTRHSPTASPTNLPTCSYSKLLHVWSLGRPGASSAPQTPPPSVLFLVRPVAVPAVPAMPCRPPSAQNQSPLPTLALPCKPCRKTAIPHPSLFRLLL
ncbi:uncharacterized protein K452DRAFT_287570, partial [Aplosporella prunicola CBS 121167]